MLTLDPIGVTGPHVPDANPSVRGASEQGCAATFVMTPRRITLEPRRERNMFKKKKKKKGGEKKKRKNPFFPLSSRCGDKREPVGK